MPISKSRNKCIGITLGDPSGIGPEIVAKALKNLSRHKGAHRIIIGDYKVFHKFSKSSLKECSFLDVKSLGNQEPSSIGRPNKQSAQASLLYLKKAVELLKNKTITALVTAPVCKKAINLIDPSFRGHTELLAKASGRKNVAMMFVSENMRVVILTRHIPLKEVPKSIHQKDIINTLQLTSESLKKIFKIRNPRIAVCGLNPHAGEGGNMGEEEQKIIQPAINQLRKKHIVVKGPFAADTLFVPKNCRDFDCILSMYHDQGLTPIKSMHFSKLINLTIGLPYIRTSPAHGTAFNIAGKNKADAGSMSEAIKFAIKHS